MKGRELINAVSTYPSIRAASKALGIPRSTLGYRLRAAKEAGVDGDSLIPGWAFSPTEEQLPDSHVGPEGIKTTDLSRNRGTRRYLLTSAQNNTTAHPQFLQNLEEFAEHLNAEIMVSFNVYDKMGYRGPVPKGDRKRQRHELWWDSAITPYVVNHRVVLAEGLHFCGELDVLATAKRPLSSMDNYCKSSSVIVPHNKFEFRCVENLGQSPPKELYTTGSVTQRNFIQRKTGQLASFHHVLGALLVEVEPNGRWHVHHINADDEGNFYWLDYRVEEGVVFGGDDYAVEALILGDIHYEKMGQPQEESVLNLAEAVKPGCVVVHDLIDFKSRNHHTRKDPLFRVETAVKNERVEWELSDARKFLLKLHDKAGVTQNDIIVVEANHNNALTRWVKETDWREDPTNAPFYLELAREMVEAAEGGYYFNPLEWATNKSMGDADFWFLHPDESYEVYDIECGMHGHIGPSGARGSAANIARLPFKTFIGHSHSPSIIDGCYSVGVSGNLDMGYNRGPSKWMHTHGIIYPNGKRAFLTVRDGKWRA